MKKLKKGQVWRLSSGEIVTVLSKSDEGGWVRVLSHDSEREAVRNLYGFTQQGAELIESNHRPAFDELLKEFIVSIVKETLAEERKTRNKR